MDLYTLGKMALPVVVEIMAVSALLTLVTGIFTAVKTLTSVQRFFQSIEETHRPPVTINIHTGEATSNPPMPAQD